MRTAILRHASSRLLKSQPDHVLVELSHAGHQPAFEAIVARYGHHLLRVARAVGPSEGAEDVVQQALFQAYRALRRNEAVGELRPWLRRIVLNASVDLSRRTGPPPESLREEALVGESVESILERQHQLARLVRALGDLPDRQREAIVMRELEGRPFEEIASEVGTSNGAARQLVRRARALLRTRVATLVPPVLLARMLASSAPQSDAVGSPGVELAGGAGMGIAGKLSAAVAVGGSALAVGTFAPSLDQPVGPLSVSRPHARSQTAQADRANPTRSPRTGELSTGPPAPSDVRQPPAPTVDSVQRGNHEGGERQAAAAGVGPLDSQSPSGESQSSEGARPDASRDPGVQAATIGEQAGPGEQVQQGAGQG